MIFHNCLKRLITKARRRYESENLSLANYEKPEGNIVVGAVLL